MRLRALATCCAVAWLACGCISDRGALSGDRKAAHASVQVYYFHRAIRCQACQKVEMLTQRAIRQAFAAELASGEVEWRSIDMEAPENTHYVDEYALHQQAVVIAEVRGGEQVRWKDLEKIWDLLEDEAGLMRYVQGEIQAYLGQ